MLAADDGGESGLTYTWSTTGTPPAPVTFSNNGSNAGKTSIATFAAAGIYNLAVVIANASGGTTTSNVTVVVNQVLTSVAVSPAVGELHLGAADVHRHGIGPVWREHDFAAQ